MVCLYTDSIVKRTEKVSGIDVSTQSEHKKNRNTINRNAVHGTKNK